MSNRPPPPPTSSERPTFAPGQRTLMMQHGSEPNADDMGLSVLSECCVSLCTAISEKMQENPLSIPTPSHALENGAQFSTRSTVGMMLNGLAIDFLVVGGPAYNSGELENGDVIEKIDHCPVTIEGLHQALIGSDIPGSTVTITVRKAKPQQVRNNDTPNALWYLSTKDPFPDRLFSTYLNSPRKESSAPPGDLPLFAQRKDKPGEKQLETRDVVLTRMATETIAERRRMFELFTAMKAQAVGRSDSALVSKIDECIQQWTKILLADSSQNSTIAENVMTLQRECLAMLEVLKYYLEKLVAAIPSAEGDNSRDRERKVRERSSAPNSAPSEQLPEQKKRDNCEEATQAVQEAELIRMKQLVERMQSSFEEMIPRQQLEAETGRLQKQISSMVPKAQYAAAQDEIQRSEMEIQRLKKNMESMVFKVQLDVAKDEVSEAQQEIQRLQERLQGMGTMGDLSSAQAEIQRLKTEMSRMQKAIENSVPKLQYVAAQDEVKRSCSLLERSEVEIQRLQSALENSAKKMTLDSVHEDLRQAQERLKGMVPKGECDALSSEVSRLQQAVSGMVSKTLYDDMQNEMQRLKNSINGMLPDITLDGIQRSRCSNEVDLLQERLRQVVHREELNIARSENQTLSTKIARLQNQLEDMVPADKFVEARDLASKAEKKLEQAQSIMQNMVPTATLEASEEERRKAAAHLVQLQERLQGMVSKADLSNAITEAEQLRSEASRLQRAIDGMVLKSQYDSLQDEMRLRQLEVERLKRCVESMVPKVQWETAEDEISRCSKELERLQERMKIMVPRSELEAAEALIHRLETEANISREQMAGMVPVQQYEALKERMDAHGRLHKSEADGLRKLIGDMVPRAESEAELARLQRIIDGQVPRAELEALRDETTALRIHAEKIQRNLAESVPRIQLEEANLAAEALRVQVTSMQDEVRGVRDELGRAARRLAESAPRREVTEARADADACRAEAAANAAAAEALRRDVAATKNDVVSVRAELSSLRARLSDAGLGEPAVFNRVLSALTLPLGAASAATIIERVSAAGNRMPVDGLCDLIDLMAETCMEGGAGPADVASLLRALIGPPARSLEEARRIIEVCNRPDPISPDELVSIRSFLGGWRQGGRQ